MSVCHISLWSRLNEKIKKKRLGSPFLFFRQRAEDCHPSEKADDAHEEYAGKDADTVDEDIAFGRSASGNERLVVFVGAGEGDTEDAGDEHQPEAAQSVNIERKGNGNCQQEINPHMRALAHEKMDLFRAIENLFRGERLVKNVGGGFDEKSAHLQTQSCGLYAVLSGK